VQHLTASELQVQTAEERSTAAHTAQAAQRQQRCHANTPAATQATQANPAGRTEWTEETKVGAGAGATKGHLNTGGRVLEKSNPIQTVNFM
jgi:hypothetical protein